MAQECGIRWEESPRPAIRESVASCPAKSSSYLVTDAEDHPRWNRAAQAGYGNRAPATGSARARTRADSADS